jgi:phosphonate transport system ATP-binding protein
LVTLELERPILLSPAAHVERSHPAPALEAEGLWFAYPGRQPVLRGVGLTAEAGRITMILGASGGGKTTLLKLCKGLLAPSQGSITVAGRPLRAAPRRGRLDPNIAYIPQQLGLVRGSTVMENVLTGALARVGIVQSMLRLFSRSLTQEARETLASLGIAHKAEEPVFNLSGGERQRVAIARALMQRPRLILADEFISQLDPVTGRETMGMMRGIAERGVALVMTTHELDVVRRHADQVVVLRDGHKVIDCPATEADVEQLGSVMKG